MVRRLRDISIHPVWWAFFAFIILVAIGRAADATVSLTGNVRFLGNLQVVGTFSKGGGSFLIDHPQKPATHLLYHSYVESPNVTNVYDGIVTLDAEGKARIRLPRYFEALNKQYTYQYFPLEETMPDLHIAQEIQGNVFVIAGGVPNGRVSWQVTGIRHDPYILANPIRNTVPKGPDEQYDVGECVLPELCK